LPSPPAEIDGGGPYIKPRLESLPRAYGKVVREKLKPKTYNLQPIDLPFGSSIE